MRPFPKIGFSAALAGGAMLFASPMAQAIDFGVDLPDPGIPGYSFPAPETTVNQWIAAGDDAAIYAHGWGVWTALTAPSGQATRGIPDPPVYLTWADPTEIANASTAVDATAAMAASQQRLILQTPRQVIHGGGQTLDAADARTAKKCGASGAPDTCILVTVNYSPSSARFVFDNKLLLETTLQTYLKAGYKQIPAFPVDAVNVKPVYKIISPAKLVDGRYYTMPAWPSTPSPAVAFPETAWGQCIYIDVQNQSKGTGAVDKGCANRTAANTYNLSDFINIPVTSKDMAGVGELAGGQFQGNPLQPGDAIILVGMHTNTREILRWAWQTFWWVPDPDSPVSPSSKAIADARPAQLQGAARNYAMASAYQMLAPAQPINGGQNVGALLAAYNPHLEAGFAPSTFQMQPTVQTPSGPVVTKYGVQSNCMTCHGIANYDPKSVGTNTYGSDFYIARDDSFFDGKLLLEFAWSILDTMVPAKPASQ